MAFAKVIVTVGEDEPSMNPKHPWSSIKFRIWDFFIRKFNIFNWIVTKKSAWILMEYRNLIEAFKNLGLDEKPGPKNWDFPKKNCCQNQNCFVEKGGTAEWPCLMKPRVMDQDCSCPLCNLSSNNGKGENKQYRGKPKQIAMVTIPKQGYEENQTFRLTSLTPMKSVRRLAK